MNQQQSEEMQRISVARLPGNHLAIKRLGFSNATRLMMLHRRGKGLLGVKVHHSGRILSPNHPDLDARQSRPDKN